MGQIATHSVLGVSVFVNNHEDAEHGTDAHPNWELATDKTITLEMLSEAIKQKDIEYMQAVFGILTAKDMVVPGVAQWLCEQALWYGHEPIGQFSWNFLLHMPLWARSYPGSPLSVALLVQTMMRLGLRKDLRTHVQPLQDPILSRLQNRPRVLRSMVKMIASFASRWSMEQLPDVVITLLLVGVDKDTTTELRRDILHSLSLLCCQLPPEPGDATEISVVEKVLALTKPLSTPNQELLLSFFTKGSPSCLRIARAVAYYVLTGSAVSPVSGVLSLSRIFLNLLPGELRPSSTRPIDNCAV
ncbi:hypothetical protein BC826DRAFT_341731 [Russula brevipes]|nr:hypothetical protein BC826DRAFT_341731 [Russula brevipes]